MVETRNICNILCTDVLLELFQYLYVDEIFKLFHGTIDHVSSLLKQGNVQLHIGHVDRQFRRHILPHIDRTSVTSIRIRNMYQMSPVDLGQFNHVNLVELHNVTVTNWPNRFPEQLKYLIIYVRSKHRQEILKKAVSLNNLRTVELHSTFLHLDGDDDDFVTEEHGHSSSIRHLIFNSRRCFINYQFMLNKMPLLQSLRSINTYYPHARQPIFGKFASLHTVDLDCRYTDIVEMISLLMMIARDSLQQCRIINIRNSLSSEIAEILIS